MPDTSTAFDPARLWNEEVAEPVAGGWPVLEVSTEGPVDLGEVVTFIRAEAETH